jgi:peptidyl-prolyl cis-trans isomerase SurA
MLQLRISERWAGLATAALVTAVLIVSAAVARAQEVIVLVDGEPITQLDLLQRIKLLQMSGPKPPPRQEVLDSMIDEILEIREAKNYSVEVPDTEVNSSYDSIAKHLGIDSAKLTEMLSKAGASAGTLKRKLRAQLAWDALVRGRYKASLQIADSDIEAQLQLHPTQAKDNVGYEYTVRPIVFIVPIGSPDTAFEARKREADALRARFDNCTSGIAFARALNGVAVRDQVIKFSADLPTESRQILDGTAEGHLTPPETTAEGVQMFAICSKKQSSNDTPEKHEIRNEIFQQKFGAKAKRYLAELRSAAMIEYKMPVTNIK